MYARYIKRLLDFILSLIAIIILSPVLLIVALLVRTKLGSPVIFKQKRPGKDEKIFTLYKFRTMTDKKNNEGKLLSDDIRLTRFGKILRSTSLDELPELFNILKGDMSIVGPRPLMDRYILYYTNEERRRHKLRPGLTGLAQVRGRNSVSWDERFNYDLQYVDNLSFFMDVSIIFETVAIVIKKDGIELGELGNLDDYREKRIDILENEEIKK